MKSDKIDHQSIKKLMDLFYAKIRVHEKLGPIFNNAIGTSDEEWERHKNKIGNFWRSMLLGEAGYSGQPLKAHLDLPEFPREFFVIWLNLFSENLNKVYEEAIAKDILSRANGIANKFQYMLYEVKH